MDRFVLSLLARKISDNITMDWLESSLADTVMLSGLDATLFIDCPFEVAWNRCQKAFLSGCREMSFKDTKGAEYNQMFSMHQKQLFDAAFLTKDRILICNSVDELTFAKRVRDKMMPLLSRISV